MIVDPNKLVGSVEDVRLVTVGDLLTVDRAAGLQGGLEEFERRYPSQFGKTPGSPFVAIGMRGVETDGLARIKTVAGQF